jgi:hypothetical protein
VSDGGWNKPRAMLRKECFSSKKIGGGGAVVVEISF